MLPKDLKVLRCMKLVSNGEVLKKETGVQEKYILQLLVEVFGPQITI